MPHLFQPMSKNSLQLSSTNALPATRMKLLGAVLGPLLLVVVGAGAGASKEEADTEGRGLTACDSIADSGCVQPATAVRK